VEELFKRRVGNILVFNFDDCINIASTFKEKAIQLDLDEDTIKESQKDIDSQIDLLKM
jgi:chaperonin cofactor prefoldin